MIINPNNLWDKKAVEPKTLKKEKQTWGSKNIATQSFV